MQIGIQWPLVLFTLIAGAGCGLLAATGCARLKIEQSKATRKTVLIVVLALLCVGGIMSVLHLAHPERFMSAISNLFSFSGIAMELIGLAFAGLATLLFLALSSAENETGEKVLAVCAIVIGVVASFFHGYAYFEVVAQQGWHTLALAFSYLFTSLAVGFLLYGAIVAHKAGEGDDEAGQALIVKIAIALAALAAIAIVFYVISLAAIGLLVNEAVLFAALAIITEIAALALALVFVRKNLPSHWLWVSAALGICGGLAVRLLMWAASSYGLSLISEAAGNRGLYLF